MNRKLIVVAALASLVACKDKAAEEAAIKQEAAAAGAAAAAALAPTFATASKGADELIPEAAMFVGSVDIAAFVKSPAYVANKLVVEAQMKDALAVAGKCGLGLDAVQRVTFGVDPARNHVAAVLDATGIGKRETLDCLHKEITAKDGREPWKFEERGGKQVLVMKDGTGHMISDDRIAIASGDWATALAELVDGKGKSAFGGTLKDVIARTDSTKPLWAAGKIPTEVVKGTPVEGAKDVAGSIDIASGVAVEVSVGFASADEATKFQAEAQKQFDQFKGILVPTGVPQAVVDSVQIAAKGPTMRIAVTASDADILALQSVMAKF